MASQDMLVEGVAPAESLRRASVNERDGRAALFAAGTCVLGVLLFLVGQLGWWTLLAGPAYLAAAAMSAMLARGRAKALLAVAITTGSMGVLVGLVKLAGLA
jgi:hypothetical protein